MNIDDDYFLLFPTCIPVKGASSSIILDLDRAAYIEIPNLLFNILSEDLKNLNIKEVKKLYDNKYNDGIDEYFNFLTEKQLGFFTKNTKPFREPEDIFYSPYKIISSIIEVNNNNLDTLQSIIKQLDELSCQILQVRCYDLIDLKNLLYHLQIIENTTIRFVEIYVKYDDFYNEKEIIRLGNKLSRALIIMHSSNSNKKIKLSDDSVREIYFTTESLTKKTTEKISKKLFTITHKMFYESRHFNSGLNRKVCVDEEGNLKNYLSHKKVFGNIKTHKIKDIIGLENFQSIYHISNDKIEKCKDCQFRYSCINNSDINKKNGLYYKIDSCNFDPYINKWEESDKSE
ncbi:grasp-with-spasm system SPASM domain peptide maturase [Kordia jejudonensis]|uniref:grasp-with-spasm system SPASM domain peptide maturase n=1 Tax=Kordia jejudonensis TaxID=1348245 RepID=UPI000629A138|nr:grasp-with-spasm system SPASM domain peptide maturase [Kordia jejudonensis]